MSQRGEDKEEDLMKRNLYITRVAIASYLMKRKMLSRALPAKVRVDLSKNIIGYCFS